MGFIIDSYKTLYDYQRKLFKDVLNDFLLILEEVNKNKWKKSINLKQVEDFNNKLLIETKQDLLNNWIKEEDIKKIASSSLFKELIWVGLNEWYETIMFNVYKWNDENTKNDNIFIIRKDIIRILNDWLLIKIANFNLIKWLEEVKQDDSYLAKFNELKNILSNEYWKNIVERQFSWLDWKEKYLEFISFKKSDIENLLKNINNIDNKKITYENHTLSYDWLHYPLQKDSQRDIFIKLFFTSDEKSYSQKEIINYLENWAWDFYDEKNRKKILDLYKAINKSIEKNLWIKKLFYLWKELDKSIIFINR